MEPPILRYFTYQHLPPHLSCVSQPFAELAIQILTVTAPGPEQSVALRKLLEAKDAAVRAALDMAPQEAPPAAGGTAEVAG
jgi:hypothetical protein